MTWRMPAEWEPHERTWMAWPPSGPTLDDLDAAGAEQVRAAWAAVAHAVARFEPVTMVVDPQDVAGARSSLAAGIDLVVAELDDCWMRDMGPTFVRDDADVVAAVNWVFNGWGAQDWAQWAKDSQIAATVGRAAGAEIIDSVLVNEGGGIHVDGAGTVLVTDTVQLDPGRNPGWSKAKVEAELRERLGVSQVVWLPRGLTRDYERFGTRGHVDLVAAFVDAGTILYHDQRNPEHPDHQVSAEVRRVLAAAGDWRLVPVPAPEKIRDHHGWVDYSYLNHYVVDGAVIACSFDDPGDARAAQVLQQAYPGREIATVDARTIFSRGGGIHCITQQQPR